MAHFFNWNSLSFRQEEVYEDRHHEHEEAEEDEQAKLQVAKHVQEDLGDKKGEEHVHRYIDTLRGRTNLEREDLTRHQPTKGSP